MAKAEFSCAHCGRASQRERSQLNRLARNGGKPFCSTECASLAKKVEQRAPGWHEARFTPQDSATHVNCAECGVDMWLPASKAPLYKRCGPACNAAWRERKKKVLVLRGERVRLERDCETCGTTFRPRPNQVRAGHGRFCSQKCNTAARNALFAPEAQAKGRETLRAMHAQGLVKVHRGPDNHKWQGGPKASIKRRIESGKAAETLRRYRKNNPDKVREFSQRRAGRKLDKLPYGTIPKIRSAQGDKCAICHSKLNGGGHVDHIVPLARGGRHTPNNLQILCAPCNLHKSDRDPIVHMQSLGRLL